MVNMEMHCQIPFKERLVAQLQEVWLADTPQLQEAALSDFMPFLGWPAIANVGWAKMAWLLAQHGTF